MGYGVATLLYGYECGYRYGYEEGVCGELGWVGFLVVCVLNKINPNSRKIILLREKSVPNATFNLTFLGFGWPWVGGLVGFIAILIPVCFSNPT